MARYERTFTLIDSIVVDLRFTRILIFIYPLTFLFVSFCFYEKCNSLDLFLFRTVADYAAWPIPIIISHHH